MKKSWLLLGRLIGGEGRSWLVLTGAMVLAFVVRTEQARRLATPQLLCDEFIYADLAKSFAQEGRLLFRGEPLHLSLLYPVLLAPAWLAERMDTTYAVAKTINAALMTASVIPLYLLGRRVVSPGWALLAPALTLLLPMTLLSGLLMTESAFMPAFLLAVYAIAIALERPTLTRQAFALTAIGLATAVRFQGIVLAAVLPTALLLVLILELRAAQPKNRVRFALERLRRYWPTAAVVIGAVVVYVALGTLRGGGLGPYEEVTNADYSLSDAWRLTKLHLADLALTSGLVPLSALILLFLRAFLGNSASPSERAFLAVAVAAVAWLLIQVGLFTSHFTSGGIAERYVFYATPLLFLALAIWLARGLPRPWIPTAFAAAAPGALVVLQPLTSALSAGLLPSSLGLFAFYRLSTELDDGVDDLVWLLRVGAVVTAVAFALLWRPVARIAIPLGLGAFLLISTHPVAGQLRQQAAATRQDPALRGNPEWIHDAVGDAEVGYLFTAGSDLFSASRTMLGVNFWNPSVRSVIYLGHRETCELTARSASIDPAAGHIVAGDGGGLPRYLVAPVGLDVAGVALAGQGPLLLYRAIQPVSLRQSVDGVHSDLWMGNDATYTRYYGPGPGQATVELSREFFTAESVPSAVRITAGPLVLDKNGMPQVGRPEIRRRWTLRNGDRRVFVLPARKLPFRVSVHIEPTFPAAGFGSGDGRQVSARVQFGFRSTG
jgi:hypothetical protein